MGCDSRMAALIWRGMDATSLWHHSVLLEDQHASIAALSSSLLLGLWLLSFLLAMPTDLLWGSGQVSLRTNQAQ